MLIAIFLVILCAVAVQGDFDEDYFFGDALRTNLAAFAYCGNSDPGYKCPVQCYQNHLCIKGKCYCIDQMSNSEMKDELETSSVSREELYEGGTALRHHIAHFCPNLDLARDCIRTCMKVGKPAFCGKDHKCYCGHKYTDPSTQKKTDVSDIYSQFKDMYIKFFGVPYFPDDEQNA